MRKLTTSFAAKAVGAADDQPRQGNYQKVPVADVTSILFPF
jgi:hypothetical protein